MRSGVVFLGGGCFYSDSMKNEEVDDARRPLHPVRVGRDQ